MNNLFNPNSIIRFSQQKKNVENKQKYKTSSTMKVLEVIRSRLERGRCPLRMTPTSDRTTPPIRKIFSRKRALKTRL